MSPTPLPRQVRLVLQQGEAIRIRLCGDHERLTASLLLHVQQEFGAEKLTIRIEPHSNGICSNASLGKRLF